MFHFFIDMTIIEWRTDVVEWGSMIGMQATYSLSSF